MRKSNKEFGGTWVLRKILKNWVLYLINHFLIDFKIIICPLFLDRILFWSSRIFSMALYISWTFTSYPISFHFYFILFRTQPFHRFLLCLRFRTCLHCCEFRSVYKSEMKAFMTASSLLKRGAILHPQFCLTIESFLSLCEFTTFSNKCASKMNLLVLPSKSSFLVKMTIWRRHISHGQHEGKLE